MFPFTPKTGVGRVGREPEKRDYLLKWKEKEGKANRSGESQKGANAQGRIFKGTPQDPLSHERTGISETATFSLAWNQSRKQSRKHHLDHNP